MRLYLAGPMTGIHRWNFDAFEEAASRLRAAGHDVVSPHEIDLLDGFDPDNPAPQIDYAATLAEDVRLLLTCDAVALLPGWQRSPGVGIERLAAMGAGIPSEPVAHFLAGPPRTFAPVA